MDGGWNWGEEGGEEAGDEKGEMILVSFSMRIKNMSNLNSPQAEHIKILKEQVTATQVATLRIAALEAQVRTLTDFILTIDHEFREYVVSTSWTLQSRVSKRNEVDSDAGDQPVHRRRHVLENSRDRYWADDLPRN